jgi:8-oxo-dGTP diphosphatase
MPESLLVPTFPTVQWKREMATFIADVPPDDGLLEPAALVFPFYGDRIVLADIATRGWCIPSGHIEPGETAEEAVRREAYEEAGAVLSEVVYIGYFLLTDIKTDVQRRAPTFIGAVKGLSAVPAGSESRGMQLVNSEDVAGLYFSWDDLLAAVFVYAEEKRQETLRSGISLAALMGENEENEQNDT